MTLLEVLVSLAIFALAAVCLGAAYANALGTLQAVAALENAHGDGRSVRAILLAEPDRRKAAQGSEMRFADGRSIRWRAQIAATNVLDLFEVRLSVRSSTAQQVERQHEETFRVLRPTWSAPEDRAKLLAAARLRGSGRTIP